MADSQYTITFHYMYATENGIPSGHTSFTLTETGGGGDEVSVTFEASSSDGGPITWVNPFDNGKDGYVGVADPYLDPTNPAFVGNVVSESLTLTPEQFNNALTTINNITNGNARETVNYNLLAVVSAVDGTLNGVMGAMARGVPVVGPVLTGLSVAQTTIFTGATVAATDGDPNRAAVTAAAGFGASYLVTTGLTSAL